MDEVQVKSFILWVPRDHVSVGEDVDEEMRMAEEMKAEDIKSEIKQEQQQQPDHTETNTMQDTIPDNWFAVRPEDLELIEKGDPYLDGATDDESDSEADQIQPDDLVALVGSVDAGEEMSFETYCYNTKDASMYLLGQTLLMSCPLAADAFPMLHKGVTKSCVAVGTFLPVIEIFENRVGTMEPLATLGKLNPADEGKTFDGHQGPVSCLQVNRTVDTSLLLSGSHDMTVRLWDCKTFTSTWCKQLHDDKINTLQWHPMDGYVFATGGEDKRVVVSDTRLPPNEKGLVAEIGEGVEHLIFSRHNPSVIMLATNEGSFRGLDVRAFGQSRDVASATLWDVTPTDDPLLAVADCSVSGCVCVTGESGDVTVYDTRPVSKNLPPTLVFTRDLKNGPIFCARSADDPDRPLLFGMGAKEVIVFDLATIPEVISTFKN